MKKISENLLSDLEKAEKQVLVDEELNLVSGGMFDKLYPAGNMDDINALLTKVNVPMNYAIECEPFDTRG